MDDLLLRKFAATKDPKAFASLMAQHLDWVYGAALRQVGDRHLAEDIVQAVFMLLSRKAAGMKAGTRLSGWLFRAVRYAAMNARTMRRRRLRHEQLAAGGERDVRSQDWWERVGPALDDAVAKLSRADRELVLARFYENRTYEEIAQGSGVSADGVRKRTSRAVAQMREFLRSRTGELPEEFDRLLAGKMASVAPAGLAQAIAASLAGSGVSATVTVLAAKAAKGFWLAKAKAMAAVVAGIAIVGGAGVVVTSRSAVVAARPATAPTAVQVQNATALPDIPKVALNAERENALYVSLVALADEAVMAQARADGAVLQGPLGGEVLAVGNEALRALLRDAWGSDVIGATAQNMIEAHPDKPRTNVRVVGAYVTVGGPAALPDGRWSYQSDDLTLYSAHAAGGRVQLSMDHKARGVLYQKSARAPALPAAATTRVSATISLGQSLVYAVPVGATDTQRWYRLAIVQTYPADAADAVNMVHLETASSSRQLGFVSQTMANDAWLDSDVRQWLMEARRTTLWQVKLPAMDESRWTWALPKGERIGAQCVADPAVSRSLVWSPGGGRVEDLPSGPRPWQGLQVAIRHRGGMDRWLQLRDGQTSVAVGAGEGEFKQIAALELRDGASAKVNGRAYRLEKHGDTFSPYFDNDPAEEVAFAQLDAAGKALEQVDGKLWESGDQKAGLSSTSVFFARDGAKAVGVFVRPRYWHTFEGIAARPAAGAPSDEEVMASFAKPLATPAPLQDGDQYEDPFAKLGVKTLFCQLDAQGSRLQWFADAKGREYLDLGGATSAGTGYRVCDGAKMHTWGGGAVPMVSHWRPGDTLEGASIVRQWTRFQQQLVDQRKIGEEMAGGIQATLYDGRVAALSNLPGKLWLDDKGRTLKCAIPGLFVVSFGYDFPDDDKWFVVPEDVKAQAKDGDAGLPLVQKMSQRPFVLERSDGLRTVRLHEALAGEDGAVYICFSTQLDAKAAEAVRLAPYGDRWGRGHLETLGFPDFDQYRAMPVAYIHAPDRSVQWWALLPKADGAKGAWRVRLELNPGTPNCIPALERAGFSHFGTVEFDLPKVDRSKVTALDEWLVSVYGDVHSYTAAMPALTKRKVKPAEGTAQFFTNQAKQETAKVKAGGFVSYYDD